MYVDNDRGASDRSKKKRPEYDAMLEAVRAGGIDIILAYSTSRLTRRPLQLEELIRLHEQTGVVIKTVASGDDDMSTEDGKFALRIKASMDAAEAGRTGERVRRQIQQRIEQGKPRHNRYRTYGYARDFSVEPVEADRIRDAYRRIIAGESIQSIVERWKADRVTVGGGKTLYHSTIKNIISNPLYAGLMRHKGQIVGRADIEPIVAEDVWNAAQTAMAARTGTNSGKGARRYLLSGIVSCGLCGFTMAGKSRKGDNYNYECAKAVGGCGKMAVSGKHLEPMVMSVARQSIIVGYKPPVAADYSEQINALKEDVEELQAGIRNRSLRVIEVRDTLSDLTKQLRKFESLQEEATASDTASQFDDWDSFTQGTIYEQVATVKRHIKGVVVETATSKAWSPERVNVYTQQGTEINGADIRITTSVNVVAKRTQ